MAKKATVGSILQAMAKLATRRVYVGVPSAKAERKDGDVMNNATIAAIQDRGSELAGIPQREFLRPGIRSAKKEISKHLREAAVAALAGDPTGVDRNLNKAGLTGQAAVRAKITEGPFIPLADSTVAKRARKGRKGAQKELNNRAKGNEPSTDLVKPLIDTGQLRQSINYVVK